MLDPDEDWAEPMNGIGPPDPNSFMLRKATLRVADMMFYQSESDYPDNPYRQFTQGYPQLQETVDENGLTFQQLYELARGITYKPYHSLAIDRYYVGGLHQYAVQLTLRVTVLSSNWHPKVAEARGEKPNTPLVTSCLLHVGQQRHEAIARIKKLFVDFEKHEVDEWLKLDDIRITNPHPEIVGLMHLSRPQSLNEAAREALDGKLPFKKDEDPQGTSSSPAGPRHGYDRKPARRPERP